MCVPSRRCAYILDEDHADYDDNGGNYDDDDADDDDDDI